MHAAVSRSTVPERAETTRPVVYTTLYDLIAAVNEAIAPGEEDMTALSEPAAAAAPPPRA